jgi:hypothetical protein
MIFDNPIALRGLSCILMDLADDEAAMRVACKIAEATGRAVIVRDPDMVAIGEIAAPTRH